jgi:hypothetical protein
MTYIILKADQRIKTYLERVDDLVLEEGETIRQVQDTFEEYAKRFVVSHNSVPCLTVTGKAGGEPVTIEISAPGYSEAAVRVGDDIQTVALVGGRGSLTLPAEVPGRYCIGPADQTVFCSAGYGSLLVIVE